MKKHLLFLFVFLFAIGKSQTTNQHLLGIHAGVCVLPEIVKADLGFDASYVYSIRRFYLRIEGGIAPKTNFGDLKKVSVFAGGTTDINDQFSFHCSGGIGGMTGDKIYKKDSVNYDMTVGGFIGTAGILLQPKFDHKLFIGLDLNVTAYDIYPTDWYEIKKYNQLRQVGAAFFFNLSISYKLNSMNNENVSIDAPWPLTK